MIVPMGFSSTRKTIDNSPGWRYCSDQKKRLFKFPIRLGRRGGQPLEVFPGEDVRSRALLATGQKDSLF
jgi:hypothetical protein